MMIVQSCITMPTLVSVGRFKKRLQKTWRKPGDCDRENIILKYHPGGTMIDIEFLGLHLAAT